MDDIMILMTKIVVDIQGFNDSHFGVFPERDRKQLNDLWILYADKNPNKFISLLSPDHKNCVVDWAINRTSFSRAHLVGALKRFVKYLEKKPNSKMEHYPFVRYNNNAVVTDSNALRSDNNIIETPPTVVYHPINGYVPVPTAPSLSPMMTTKKTTLSSFKMKK